MKALRRIQWPLVPCKMNMFLLDQNGNMLGSTTFREEGARPRGYAWMSRIDGTASLDAWEALWEEHEISGLSALAAANLLNQLHANGELPW